MDDNVKERLGLRRSAATAGEARERFRLAAEKLAKSDRFADVLNEPSEIDPSAATTALVKKS